MAAGQGFKTFTTGEVLTAGDVNGYLMQGINVFASSAARAAAITSPQEGQYSFLKDTNALEYYDGAAWVGAPVGDITAVTAGTGISGGGSSGDVTITNSMATAIDAKGDLVAGTGADTFARLAVGANDTVLTADSSTATGLKWATPASSTPTFAGCSLYRASSQVLTNNVNTAVLWDNEEFDTDSFHSTSTNTSRITIPSGKAGKYLFVWNLSYYANATQIRETTLKRNGTTLTYQDFPVSSNNSETSMAASYIATASVNDYFEMFAYQNSGGDLDLRGSAVRSFFSCTYLGA